jgi:hypothetical protein
MLYFIKDLPHDSRDREKRGRHTEGCNKINKKFHDFYTTKIGILLRGFLLQISRLFTISRIVLLCMRNGVTVT